MTQIIKKKKKNQAIPLAADQPIVRLILNLVLTLGPVNYGMKRGGDLWYQKWLPKSPFYT